MSSNQSQRQEASNENVETRQTQATERSENYAEAYHSGGYYGGRYYPPPPPVYGGYYYDDDDDEAAALVAGVVIGAAVASASQSKSTTTTTTTTTASPPPANAQLPCNPNVVVSNGVTYYQCGNNWYMQAYGSSGPIYMPVPPPG
jgi:hypothetical protein